jgi:hypothetical protein
MNNYLIHEVRNLCRQRFPRRRTFQNSERKNEDKKREKTREEEIRIGEKDDLATDNGDSGKRIP